MRGARGGVRGQLPDLAPVQRHPDDLSGALRDLAGNPVTGQSPELVVPLPAPSDVERQYLEQRPFRRVGYETWWRLPVSDNMLLNIRHAGL